MHIMSVSPDKLRLLANHCNGYWLYCGEIFINLFSSKSVVITADEQFHDFEEKQKIFEQPETYWIDVDDFEHE